MARYMPCEYVAQMTGHDLRAVSALFEYLEAQLAATMPGMFTLALVHFVTLISLWPRSPSDMRLTMRHAELHDTKVRCHLVVAAHKAVAWLAVCREAALRNPRVV